MIKLAWVNAFDFNDNLVNVLERFFKDDDVGAMDLVAAPSGLGERIRLYKIVCAVLVNSDVLSEAVVRVRR